MFPLPSSSFSPYSNHSLTYPLSHSLVRPLVHCHDGIHKRYQSNHIPSIKRLVLLNVIKWDHLNEHIFSANGIFSSSSSYYICMCKSIIVTLMNLCAFHSLAYSDSPSFSHFSLAASFVDT